MLKKTLSALCLMAFAFACGGGGSGGSGVSGSKTVVSLSAGERTDLCEYLVDVIGPERTVTCNGEPQTIGGESAAECEMDLAEVAMAAPNCPVTVAQYEDCIEAFAALTDEQLCANTLPPACAPLFNEQCSGQ